MIKPSASRTYQKPVPIAQVARSFLIYPRRFLQGKDIQEAESWCRDFKVGAALPTHFSSVMREQPVQRCPNPAFFVVKIIEDTWKKVT